MNPKRIVGLCESAEAFLADHNLTEVMSNRYIESHRQNIENTFKVYLSNFVDGDLRFAYAEIFQAEVKKDNNELLVFTSLTLLFNKTDQKFPSEILWTGKEITAWEEDKTQDIEAPPRYREDTENEYITEGSGTDDEGNSYSFGV